MIKNTFEWLIWVPEVIFPRFKGGNLDYDSGFGLL